MMVQNKTIADITPDQKVLLVDMDGTLARFHDEADYLERMFEEGFFENLNPFKNMVEAVRLFIEQNPDVLVCTCSAGIQSPYCEAEKNAWMDKWLPEIPKENRIYTEMGRSKAEYLPDGANKNVYLLDDYNRGLHKFMHDGGSAIKVHNNINQKGKGNHGGERGYMWEGPMIHTEDRPELIAAELADLMGLEYDIEKVAEACGIVYGENEETLPQDDRMRMTLTQVDLPMQRETGVFAAHDARTRDSIRDYFGNPFNAIRSLCGNPNAFEYRLKTYDGDYVRATGYQLQAVCQNVYGDTNFDRYLHADRSQVADEVKKYLTRRDQAVVGFTCQVGHAGDEFDMTPHYDHESMNRVISGYERNNCKYRAEWFVEQIEPEKEHEPHGPVPFHKQLEEAQRRAGTQNGCGTGKEPGFV